jgi:hypothetical protein
MKRALIIGLCLLCFQFASYSQAKGGNTLESYKIAFLTRKLNFSPDEAQKFWPVYNKYVAEIAETRKGKAELDEVSFEEKLVNVRKKYKTEFTKILNEDKSNQFFQAEKEFNNTLRKELQQRIAEEKKKP